MSTTPPMKAAHPLMDKVPKTSASDFAILRNGIQTKGQIHPIVTKDGLIWDGRNRQAICLELGIEPRYEEYPGPLTAAEYILQANLRRNLSAEQRDAMIVALAEDVVPQMREEAREAKKNGQLRGAAALKKAFPANEGKASNRKSTHTQDRFRDLIGHTRKADDAIAVLDHGDLAAKVKKGEVSLRNAAQEAVARNKARRSGKSKSKEKGLTRAELRERAHQMNPGRFGLTREQVDPDFKGSAMDFLDTYGHVQIMTKDELAADRKQSALMDWLKTLSDLRIPLEKHVQAKPFELSELEAYIGRSLERRLQKLNEMVSLITMAKQNIEPVLPLLSKLSVPKS